VSDIGFLPTRWPEEPYFKTYNDPLAGFWLTRSALDIMEAHDDKVILPADERIRVQPVRIELSANSTDRTEYVVTFASTSDSRLEETFTVRGEAPTYTINNGSHQWTPNMHPRKWILSAEESITPLLSAILSLHHARALK